MGKRVSIGIGLPLTSDRVHTPFFLSFVMMNKGKCELFFPTHIYGSYPTTIADTRTSIVSQALKAKCTHLVFMDTDQVYPEDTIQRLISHDLDIVGAKVHRRWPPFDPILYRGPLDKFQMVSEEEWKNSDLVEVSATGTGCLMIKTEVFKKIKPPWFQILKNDGGGESAGEDMSFCIKAIEAGFKIFVDTTIKVGHLGTINITQDFYDVYQAIARRTEKIIKEKNLEEKENGV